MKVRFVPRAMKGKFMAVDEGIRNAYLRGDVGPTCAFTGGSRLVSQWDDFKMLGSKGILRT